MSYPWKWHVTVFGICISGIVMGVAARKLDLFLALLGIGGYIFGIWLNGNLMEAGGFKK